jgi:hypothetical protein
MPKRGSGDGVAHTEIMKGLVEAQQTKP